MWTITHIKAHIARLQQGQIFTTRELLSYGKRANVDQVMSRLVKSEVVIRLARGVFIRNDDGIELPSVWEVAKAKAAAFAKNIYRAGDDAWVVLGLKNKGQQTTTTFATSGRSSRFWYRDSLICFIGMAPRKLALGDSKPGLVLRALWQLNKDGCTWKKFSMAVSTLNRTELKAFRAAAGLMPHWLSDLVTAERKLKPCPKPIAPPFSFKRTE
ncbi:MAG TPA: DUF6088 family protein [Candidatus Obscuribacterales bacterium]